MSLPKIDVDILIAVFWTKVIALRMVEMDRRGYYYALCTQKSSQKMTGMKKKQKKWERLGGRRGEEDDLCGWMTRMIRRLRRIQK